MDELRKQRETFLAEERARDDARWQRLFPWWRPWRPGVPQYFEPAPVRHMIARSFGPEARVDDLLRLQWPSKSGLPMRDSARAESLDVLAEGLRQKHKLARLERQRRKRSVRHADQPKVRRAAVRRAIAGALEAAAHEYPPHAWMGVGTLGANVRRFARAALRGAVRTGVQRPGGRTRDIVREEAAFAMHAASVRLARNTRHDRDVDVPRAGHAADQLDALLAAATPTKRTILQQVLAQLRAEPEMAEPDWDRLAAAVYPNDPDPRHRRRLLSTHLSQLARGRR